MNTRRSRAIASVLLLPLVSLACLSTGPAGQARRDLSNYTPIPVTAKALLPPEWTATPEVAPPIDIPGWDRFDGKGVSIWLPKSWIPGNPEQDLNEFVEPLRMLGGGFAQSAEELLANPYGLLLWAVDGTPTTSGAATNMNVTKEDSPPDSSMQDYLDDKLRELPAEFRVVESELVALARYPEAAALIYEFTAQGITFRAVTYLVKVGGMVWTVEYGTGAQEFDQLLPIFEQSISTLTVQP
jgi:hypothetical protein